MLCGQKLKQTNNNNNKTGTIKKKKSSNNKRKIRHQKTFVRSFTDKGFIRNNI